MRVALAQICSTGDVAGNGALVAEQVRAAAGRGAELVVFPEATMRAFGHNLTRIAEPLDGPWASGVRAVAAECGVTVVAGMFTPGDTPDRVRNTLLVTGPGIEAAYTKVHLYDAFGYAESRTVEPGTEPVVVTIGGIRFGLAICYDIRFPRLFTTLAERGAEAILVPTSWGAGPGKIEQWDLLVQARGLDATAYILASAQADPAAAGVEARAGAPTGIGRSAVIGPQGRVLVRAGDAPELLVYDLDVSDVAAVRQQIPVLDNTVHFV
ncbi:carbon-nitrogen hydrolase family protein [Granulicoccus phenolivorans]|uniref:carbon-nitrogen hydrolase family protein n=1 Tax=Granulicoccus phenolivorans TaxID=266854 RepID=UPI00041CA304|nr:carbon-nitrogen hydrolase family protein [Granulicoccus phenolivorans]